MLYTSSNDGFLHGFKVSANDEDDDAPTDDADDNPALSFG